jgi:hypothetical protein
MRLNLLLHHNCAGHDLTFENSQKQFAPWSLVRTAEKPKRNEVRRVSDS